MIQRIQTLYLALAGIAIALMLTFPIISFYGDYHTFSLWLIELKNLVPDNQLEFSSSYTYPLFVFASVVFLISIFTIFKYKNRKLQLKLIKINVLLNILLIIGIFLIYPRMIKDAVSVIEEYKTSAFFPLISLVFLMLAYRGVKKDDELVRSADRLR